MSKNISRMSTKPGIDYAVYSSYRFLVEFLEDNLVNYK